MQHLACVAEVPPAPAHAGCLEPRLLMLWTLCLGFQRVTDCGWKSSDSLASAASSALHASHGPNLRTCSRSRSFTVTLVGRECVGDSPAWGTEGGIAASEN